MKFRRNVLLYRGSLDAAPLATVFFLLVIFLMLGSRIYTPGVHIQLARASDVSGTDKRTITVAIDSSGRFYLDNQIIDQPTLKTRLTDAVKASPEPLALIVFADKDATEAYRAILFELAKQAGIEEAIDARLPSGNEPVATGKTGK